MNAFNDTYVRYLEPKTCNKPSLALTSGFTTSNRRGDRVVTGRLIFFRGESFSVDSQIYYRGLGRPVRRGGSLGANEPPFEKSTTK